MATNNKSTKANETTKKTTTTTKTTKSSSGKTSATSLLDQLAFWAVLALALVMIINVFINFLSWCGVNIPSLSVATGILNKFAMAIAIGITIFCSYFVARRKSKNLWILWLVSAILVGFSFILGIAII